MVCLYHYTQQTYRYTKPASKPSNIPKTVAPLPLLPLCLRIFTLVPCYLCYTPVQLIPLLTLLPLLPLSHLISTLVLSFPHLLSLIPLLPHSFFCFPCHPCYPCLTPCSPCPRWLGTHCGSVTLVTPVTGNKMPGALQLLGYL